ncbi:MAG: ATP-binding protein [Oscillospiraceae bacterium]
MNEVLLKQEKSYYLNQCDLMKESTEQLRAFRHDMKNQLFVIKEMCDKNLCGEASVQLGKYAEGLEIKTYYSNSGNMVIDSLINYKLKNADVDGINVETEISVPSKINIEVRDLVTILGNLLDNSLTALESVSENKNLYIKVVYDRGRVIISVKNTYAIPVKYVNGEIVSTKEDSENHGYGLKNIKKTVEKYDGYIEDDHANNTFSVDIILFVKPELDNE